VLELVGCQLQKLDAKAKVLIKRMLLPKQLFQVRVEVHGARLIATAEESVERSGHLVLNLVPKSNQKSQIIRCVFVERRRVIGQAAFQLPKLVRTSLGAIKYLPFRTRPRISVVYPLGPIVGVQQVRPRNYH
jgi:hypothetical protein